MSEPQIDMPSLHSIVTKIVRGVRSAVEAEVNGGNPTIWNRTLRDGDRPAVHVVKCWPEYYSHIVKGEKTFEVRRNDRDYRQHDFIVLCEYDPQTSQFSGRAVVGRIGYIMSEFSDVDFKDFIVFSFIPLNFPESPSMQLPIFEGGEL